MKKMLILLMLILSVPIGAQARLGSTMDSLEREYSDPTYKSITGSEKNGDIFLSITTEMAKVTYFFDMFNRCYVVQIIPFNKDYVYWYGEKYNRDFKAVSSVKWRAKIDTVIADIYLTYPDSTKFERENQYLPFFTWFYAEE